MYVYQINEDDSRDNEYVWYVVTLFMCFLLSGGNQPVRLVGYIIHTVNVLYGRSVFAVSKISRHLPMKDEYLFVLYSQHRGCWWPGDTKTQDTVSLTFRDLQNILTKFVNCRNRTYYENFKLKRCACAQSPHVHNFRGGWGWGGVLNCGTRWAKYVLKQGNSSTQTSFYNIAN